MLKESGLWLRRDYPGIADLTRYSGNAAGKWGSRTPPADVKAIGQEHLIRTATHAKTFEEVRDLLHNGYCISSCGSEAFSNKRDDNGVSKRSSGVWYHAMAYLGCDDRETTKAKYGEPLVMIQNSWGRWNTGSRKVMNSVLEIPEGGFWARWSDIKGRYIGVIQLGIDYRVRMYLECSGNNGDNHMDLFRPVGIIHNQVAERL